MKLIIAGSRDLKPSFAFVDGAISLTHPGTISEVVSGGASGVDNEGEHWASHRKVPVKRFPADWDEHGKAAGPIRNKEMAQYADALLLIWDGQSKGSANMKAEMERLKKPVFEIVVKK